MSSPKDHGERWKLSLNQVRDLHSTALDGREAETNRSVYLSTAYVLYLLREEKRIRKRMKREILAVVSEFEVLA